MAEHLQATFWGKIKDDGRLVGRGSPGIKAHLGSVVSCIHLIMSVRLMSRLVSSRNLVDDEIQYFRETGINGRAII